MRKYGTYAIAAALVLAFCLPALAQQEVDDNTVIRVLQTSYPKLEAKQIDVGMIKKLNNRIKVNLKVADVPAILYLTWQRHRNQYRWWYERNEHHSFVFLGKKPPEVSKLATVTRPKAEPDKSKPAAQVKRAEEPRIETIELGKEKKNPAARKGEPMVLPSRKAEEKQPAKPAKETPAAKQPETKKPDLPEAKPVDAPVKKEAEKEEAPKAEKKAEPEPKPAEATPKKEEPKAPAEKPIEKEKAVEEPKAAREELQAELTKKAPSAKKEPVAKSETPKDTTAVPEPVKTEEPQPVPLNKQPEAAAETPGEQSPFLPVPTATGPAATPREFLSTLVMTIGNGNEQEYPNFLFRPSEMAIEVQERDFQRAVNAWSSQFDVVHQQIKGTNHVSIRRVLLQRPQTRELERTTRASLQRQVKTVLRVYNFVKIDLSIDGQPAYITIGGLVQTEGGWRVAGRIELVKQASVQ